MDLYFVSVKFHYQRSKEFHFNIIEIMQMRKIVDLEEMQYGLVLFEKQMKTYLNVTYPLQKELERINSLKNYPSVVGSADYNGNFTFEKLFQD